MPELILQKEIPESDTTWHLYVLHLNLENLNYLYVNIPWLKEVSIGHSLISDALYMGLEKTIKAYKNCLNTPAENARQ